MPPIVPLPKRVTSRKHARRITTAYHAITEQIHNTAADAVEQGRLQQELAELGGVQAYQQASALNTALHSTSRWVVSSLRACGTLTAGRGAPRPRVLEVGAINTQLLDCKGLQVRAIDLHSSEPRIEQCDFLSMLHGGELDSTSGVTVSYDAVVCSMVLNCVPDPRRRFDMLVGMRSQLRLGGRCFITVPRTCLSHSFTIDEELFRACLIAVGLPPVGDGPTARGVAGVEAAASTVKETGGKDAGGKLAWFECVAALPDVQAAQRFQRGRHERRRALSSRGAARRKSRGAGFDVDLGGYLGFGERVPRSYEENSASRREQAAATTQFLRQCAAEDMEAATAVASATANGAAVAAALGRQQRGSLLTLQQLAVLQRAGGGEVPALPEEDDGHRGTRETSAAESNAKSAAKRVAKSDDHSEVVGSLETTSEWQLIAAAAARVPPEQLDFGGWRWYDPSAASGAGPQDWTFVPSSAEPPAGSSYDTSGWGWTEDGWKWRQPTLLKGAPQQQRAAREEGGTLRVGSASSQVRVKVQDVDRRGGVVSKGSTHRKRKQAGGQPEIA